MKEQTLKIFLGIAIVICAVTETASASRTAGWSTTPGKTNAAPSYAPGGADYRQPNVNSRNNMATPPGSSQQISDLRGYLVRPGKGNLYINNHGLNVGPRKGGKLLNPIKPGTPANRGGRPVPLRLVPSEPDPGDLSRNNPGDGQYRTVTREVGRGRYETISMCTSGGCK